MKKTYIFLTVAFALLTSISFAQVGIGTTDPKGALDLVSTNSGIILPRVANTAAVTTPVNGMIIYDISFSCIKGYANSAWTGCLGPIDTSTNGTGVATSYGAPACTANTITGAMATGTVVSGVTMKIYANVTTLGDYNITAGPTNGVTFRGTGTFASLGCQLVTLTGNGTAVADGMFTYTTDTSPAATVDATVVNFPIATLSAGGGNTITFMAHNLGADESLDPHTPVKGLNGDYYQWGRNAPSADVDALIGAWGSQGGTSDNGNWTPTTKGPQDPCPSGFRVPSSEEWAKVNDNNTASRTGLPWTASPTEFGNALHYGPDASTKLLTLPATGFRNYTDGNLYIRGSNGYYWSSTENGINAQDLNFNSSITSILNTNTRRTNSLSVRCTAE